MQMNKENGGSDCIEKLCKEVREAAYESVESLWNAFLDVGKLDILRATEKALRLLSNHGDYTGALKVLEGIYALVEIAPEQTFTDCQQHPALVQMFMDEFLTESGDFIFDVGTDDVLEFLVEKS